MSYLYDGVSYDNYAPEFMAGLGMDDATIASVIAQRDYDQCAGQLAARQRAYEAESDPLFLEWQYDKTPAAETRWRDKVAEIKARYPVAQAGES
ncbi:hypothetical protein GIS01_14930 [Aeromonas veronii]|nr:hypothetical protein GIS01_14930 [Aeromonas veronii]